MIFEINFVRGSALTSDDRQTVLKRVKIAIAAASAILISLIVIIFITRAGIRRAENEINSFTRRIEQINSEQNIEEWGGIWHEFRNKISVAESVFEERGNISEMLIEISNLIPDSMRVTRIIIPAGASKVMNIDLVSLPTPKAVDEINEFINAVESSPAFNNAPQLVTQREERVSGQNVIYFELRVSLD